MLCKFKYLNIERKYMKTDLDKCCHYGVPIDKKYSSFLMKILSAIDKRDNKVETLVEVIERTTKKCKYLRRIKIESKVFYFCDNRAIGARALKANGGYAISTELIELQDKIHDHFMKKYKININEKFEEKEKKCCDIEHVVDDIESRLIRNLTKIASEKGLISRKINNGKFCKIEKSHKGNCHHHFVIKKGEQEYCDNPNIRVKELLKQSSKDDGQSIEFE